MGYDSTTVEVLIGNAFLVDFGRLAVVDKGCKT